MKRFLMRSVSISDRRIVFQLLDESPPASWSRTALLKNYRLVFLDDKGTSEIGKYEIALDAESGVVVFRRE